MNAKKILVSAALGGLLLAILALLYPIYTMQQLRSPANASPETRLAVEASLARLLPAGAASAQDPVLQAAVKALRAERYVSAAWVVDESGVIVVHEGGPGRAGDAVSQVGRDMMVTLDGLPAKTIDRVQTLQLAALGAIRSEGEHNDVFRHLVQPLFKADGSLGALVVVAYDINPQMSSPNAAYIALLLLSLAGLAVYWLALPVWVYLDARQQGEPSGLWVLFVLATNLVGLLAYLISTHPGRMVRKQV